jgi:bifunctional UDP-N-acetylglucosamine pyrophosphorylase/glucosamine-1-phosphate N-acetyltransferase
MSSFSLLILAAGKGTRMKSDRPKVLHTVGGVTLLERVLKTGLKLKPQSVCVIVGHGASDVKSSLRAYPDVAFATQRVLDGSGGAVRQALSWLKKQRGDVIVACGDAPLIQKDTLRDLLSAHRRQKNAATVLTAKMPNPFGYGRIVRGAGDAVVKIVEHLDATLAERDIDEINTGTYCFNAKELARVLPRLSNKNAKREYYLTDTLALLNARGRRVGGAVCADAAETQGINSRVELAQAETALNRRTLRRLMDAGVSLIDPASTYIGDDVEIGPDTIVWPQTYLLGKTRIGRGCQIGPWTHIKDSVLENDVFFQSSFCENAVVRRGAKVGPYARIRPGTDVGRDAHVGNYTELKNTRLGAGSKANHLSYLGDAEIGKNVNIGAGSITCNYDGLKKSPTQIQDNAFIGSNTNLIAPITIGEGVVIGAGSTLASDVPAWSLAVERSKAVVKAGWGRKRFLEIQKKKGQRS